MTLSEDENRSIKNIIEFSFINKGGKGFNGVRVFENRVSFETLDGAYALIYSVDGSIPEFVNDPSEKGKTNYEKIADHWYNARIMRKD